MDYPRHSYMASLNAIPYNFMGRFGPYILVQGVNDYFFLDDYGSVVLESLKLDEEPITLSAATAGPKYADILALSTRQAYGGIDLTFPMPLSTPMGYWRLSTRFLVMGISKPSM
jgi:hypothetical protein